MRHFGQVAHYRLCSKKNIQASIPLSILFKRLMDYLLISWSLFQFTCTYESWTAFHWRQKNKSSSSKFKQSRKVWNCQSDSYWTVHIMTNILRHFYISHLQYMLTVALSLFTYHWKTSFSFYISWFLGARHPQVLANIMLLSCTLSGFFMLLGFLGLFSRPGKTSG